MATSLYRHNSWNLLFWRNSVPKDGKRSVLAVMIAALNFLFVKNFWHILNIFRAFYGNFLIWA